MSDETDEPDNTDEFVWIAGRRTDFTYLTSDFPVPTLGDPKGRGRFVIQVFDTDREAELLPLEEAETYVIRESEKGRSQVKVLIANQPNRVVRLTIQRVRHRKAGPRSENLITLEGASAQSLIEFLCGLDELPTHGGDSYRISNAALKQVASSPDLMQLLYARNPRGLEEAVEEAPNGRDIIALRHRREQIERFERLLNDPGYFVAEVARLGKGEEWVWQSLFNENPWMLGLSVGSQLLTAWDPSRLSQIVGGGSVSDVGKITDALLRTSGAVRWLTFGEFKTHNTPLLAGSAPRPGVWPPSAELVAGVAQSQVTVQRALLDIREELRGKAKDGTEIPDDVSFLMRPRSFLLIGNLRRMIGTAGGGHLDKIRSFELYRRSISDPEIITFDELLVRARALAMMDLVLDPRGDD